MQTGLPAPRRKGGGSVVSCASKAASRASTSKAPPKAKAFGKSAAAKKGLAKSSGKGEALAIPHAVHNTAASVSPAMQSLLKRKASAISGGHRLCLLCEDTDLQVKQKDREWSSVEQDTLKASGDFCDDCIVVREGFTYLEVSTLVRLNKEDQEVSSQVHEARKVAGSPQTFIVN